MPDDKTQVGEPDRSRVAADQNYEVRYLAQKFGMVAAIHSQKSSEERAFPLEPKPRKGGLTTGL